MVDICYWDYHILNQNVHIAYCRFIIDCVCTCTCTAHVILCFPPISSPYSSRPTHICVLLLSTHADRQGVMDISVFLYFLCMFVRLRISPVRIKLAASNFAGRFTGVQGKECPILWNFAPQKPKIGLRIGHRAHWTINRAFYL